VGAGLGFLTAARDADGSGLDETEIRDEISTFLVAGYETTAMALTWSLALLSSYPQARQRVEDEADAMPGDGPGDPDQLPWTTAVVSEAMRLYPPAWTLERTALADDDVCGTTVPAVSMVAVLPYLVHRNPRRMAEPDRLDLASPGLPRPRGLVTLRPADGRGDEVPQAAVSGSGTSGSGGQLPDRDGVLLHRGEPRGRGRSRCTAGIPAAWMSAASGRAASWSRTRRPGWSPGRCGWARRHTPYLGTQVT
jgi:cytochrome P450